jgi:GTP-binding protein
MADIAGIIEGAHEGAGLGHDFLKHIERTKLLIHVVDISGSEARDPKEDFEKINRELELFRHKLSEKPQIAAANKSDLIDENDVRFAEFAEFVRAKGIKVFSVSAATGKGVRELLAEAAARLSELSEVQEDEALELFDFEKDELDGDYREVYAGLDNGVFTLSGKQLEKIFNSTNFNDMGSLRYLYKYVEKSGAMAKLKEMGLSEGDVIRIKGFEFEYFDD